MSSSRPRRRTWRQAAGRNSGRAGYQIGDFTRSLYRSICRVNWKEASGRHGGGASYEVGDISRSLIRGVWNALDSDASNRQCLGGRGKFEGESKAAWRMFFAQAELCGLEALAQGVISEADVEEQAPYLFLGLPGLTLLELALQSVDAPKGTLTLASGATVSIKERAKGGDNNQLFKGLLCAAKELKVADFNTDELDRLRRAVLLVEGDEPCGGDADRSAQINQAASIFQTMATDISQLQFFRAHFLEVLAKVVAHRPAPEAGFIVVETEPNEA